MGKIGRKIIVVLITVLIAYIYYYITLPALNYHSVGFWVFIIAVMILLLILLGRNHKKSFSELKESKAMKLGVILLLVVVAAFIIGGILSSPIVNAKKYQQLLTVAEGVFTEDIEEISYEQIPMLDKSSAQLLGDRKMGSMVDMVSQFDASDHYTQINYQGTPVRVTPLEYASLIKWFANQKDGLPAYIKIDMTTQNVEAVKLEEGIKYSDSEHFGRNLNRYLRFRYPTYIFDEINFEIDESGTPYWICPVLDYTIGLFGGETVSRVVLLNAVSGETSDLAVEDVPVWVDRVYSSELLMSYYDYYGTLKHGYLNSILGQKDCLQTTEGYNYIALADDVWLYTGITSVTGDRSNVGFVLINQRTMETRYYSVEGATELSAMSSAEGQVQEMGYMATFPLLLNTSDEPTYFIALKDDEGLVKKYAMVNVERYQIVAIGDSVLECEKNYIQLLSSNGISNNQNQTISEVTGVIRKIADAVVDGNSHFYIILENQDEIFDVSIADDLQIIKYNAGDRITLEYTQGKSANIVLSIK